MELPNPAQVIRVVAMVSMKVSETATWMALVPLACSADFVEFQGPLEVSYAARWTCAVPRRANLLLH